MQKNEEQPKKSSQEDTLPTLPMVRKDFKKSGDPQKNSSFPLQESDTTDYISTNNRLFLNEEDPDIDEASIKADLSMEFRRQLNRNGTRYRIERVLAIGGFGKIFLAEDRVLGRKAIVKSLKDEF